MVKQNADFMSTESGSFVTRTLTDAVSATAGLELAIIDAEVHMARRSLHAQEPCIGVDHLYHACIVPCQSEGSRHVLPYERPCRIQTWREHGSDLSAS
jgi:hypothetical protein